MSSDWFHWACSVVFVFCHTTLVQVFVTQAWVHHVIPATSTQGQNPPTLQGDLWHVVTATKVLWGGIKQPMQFGDGEQSCKASFDGQAQHDDWAAASRCIPIAFSCIIASSCNDKHTDRCQRLGLPRTIVFKNLCRASKARVQQRIVAATRFDTNSSQMNNQINKKWFNLRSTVCIEVKCLDDISTVASIYVGSGKLIMGSRNGSWGAAQKLRAFHRLQSFGDKGLWRAFKSMLTAAVATHCKHDEKEEYCSFRFLSQVHFQRHRKDTAPPNR